MNKNYRLLSFRSFFIFSFLSFFEGSPSSGFFFGWGREAKNTVLPESYFLHSDFFTFFIFTLFHFLHFLHFQIFSLFYIFTILQFFRGHSSRCFFLCGEMLKIFLGGCAGLDYFLKKMGGGPDWSNGPTTIMWQTACLVFNPIMVDDYAALFS